MGNYYDEWREKKRLKNQLAVSHQFPLRSMRNEDEEEQTTDIAPLPSQEEQSSWFYGGALQDGYEFGDVTKTILGSVGDLLVGATKGVGRTVEGIVDLGTYGVGAIGGLFDENFYEEAKKVAQYSAIDEWAKPAEDALAPYSVLGDKADSVAEGLGQIGLMIATSGASSALGASNAATNAITMGTIGLSSTGSGMNQAYQEGANDQEAVTYGLIAGGAEAVSEMIFGGLSKASKILGIGRGVSSLDDTIAKGLASKFKSTFAKNLTEYIVKAGAEGAEEVISGSIQALGKALTYKQAEKPEEWASNLWSLVQDENLMESFIIGTITSGITQSGGAIKSTYRGTDYITGFTQNEQKVIDAEINKRVEERKASGEILSKADIGKIQKSVEADMERGNISIDTIENTLGNVKYNNIINKTPDQIAKLRNRKSALETEIKNAIFKKNPEAKKDFGGNKALEMFDKVVRKYYDEVALSPVDRKALDSATAELKSVTEALRQYDNIDNLKKARGSEVFELLSKERNGQGSKLLSSYAELAKKKVAFNVKLDEVAPEKQATYKRAMESGVWNNTNKTHDFVDLVANIEARTGLKIEFANTKMLAEKGYAIEGAVVNGVRTKEGIILNANSTKSLEVVVGHEITHIVEKAKHYDELREHLIAYAKAKGDYQARRDALVKLYAKTNADGSVVAENGKVAWKTGVEGIYEKKVNGKLTKMRGLDVDGEVVADLVGEYLFTNEDYIRKLVTRRNLFQRIFDEIKHLVKIAKADSREQKELLRVQKSFEKVFNEIANSNHIYTSDSIKYNLSAVEEHKKNLEEKYSVEESTVELEELQKRYDKIIDIWEKLGGEIDSKFLEEWNNKTGKKQAFEVFKKQDGYKYNVELSTMCKKGVALFEAIDTIVRKEVMKQLNVGTIGKAEKQILYDILKSGKNYKFEIPCAICYVEQARQREGTIINNFVNGYYNTDRKKQKLGWNETLTKIEEKMAEKGVNYKFPTVDRSVATDNYNAVNIVMDTKTEEAFYNAVKDVANEAIKWDNADPQIKTRRPLIKEATPENIMKSLKGRKSENLAIFDVLINEDKSRFKIDTDLLYSSMTSSNLARTHQKLYTLFNIQGGQQGYKTKQSPIVYWGDILGKPWNPATLRNASGIRNQSNSDFQMYTLLDQAQMYIDLTAKGYYLHAYTKVISELKLFGLSNGKINASLIPKIRKIYKEGATEFTDANVDIEKTMEYAGLDADGNPIYDDIEGINHEEAFMLIRDKDYSKSVGGVCIGYSDRHILKLLDTPEVQVIIGYHDKTDDITKRYKGARYAKNYNGYNQTIGANGKTRSTSFGTYLTKAENCFTKSGEDFVGEFTFNGKTYTANDIPKLAADFYLADCRKNNWTPMYSIGGMNFSNHPNYYKLLADFSLYDSEGNYAPHKKVSYDMPETVPYLDANGAKQYMKTEEYIKKELEAEMSLRNSLADALGDKSEDGIIPRFIKAVNELHAEKQFSLSNELTTENSAPQGKYTGMAYEGEPISPTTETETETETPTEDIAPTVDKVVENVDTPERIKVSAIKPNLDEIAPEKVNTDESKVKIGVKDISTNTERIIAKPNPDGHTKLLETKPIAPVANETKTDNTKVAKVSIDAPVVPKKQGKSLFRTHFLDDASVIEDLALKTKNRELQSKFNFMKSSNQRGQYMIGKGVDGVKSLDSIRKKVEVGYGKLQEFSDYMYHMHNIDRMTLDKRFKTANKAVFGDSVTADVSRKFVAEMEAKEPWVKEVAKEIYAYNRHLRNMLVDAGIISAQTAELWEKMYPHYVPISREGDNGANVNVPLATNRTGVNAPVKKAVGGDGDISALFNTMADRTMQVFRAVARNNFGIELRNTIQTESESVADNIDLDDLSVIDNGELIQQGKNGKNPTFTVFDNGKRVTFEITEAMYEALKPTDPMWQDRQGWAWDTWRGINKARRNLITSWNPAFLLTNGIKDIQDVIMNSQHPLKTYANFITAGLEMVKGGHYLTEYLENGGGDLTYFDNSKKDFKNDSTFKKIVGMPLSWITKANNFIERMPRLAEYIASRKSGASIETAMLDAARVTTNFQAGGDVTKWLNRNGFAFLNASVQGTLQQVRNIREAKMNGFKGWLSYATKFAIAGLPAVLLNALIWGDDDEYEDLSDYVKDNYYIVGKFNDGTFVRIPKGRTVAVIQEAFEQMGNAITGDDEVDMEAFKTLVINNLTPNAEDNFLLAPIDQALKNKAWHGGEIVPTRLQNVPEGEQYDETIDLFSKWLGENMNVSPYKINYILDQYTGVIGDIALPMMTPEATSGAENPLEYAGAMFGDKFSANATLDNQNVTDFYDTLEELEKNANSAYATDEDILKHKYFSSISTQISDKYKDKRAIQGGGLGKADKYEYSKQIQEEINTLAKNALENYNNVQYGNGYAQVGDTFFYNNGDGWKKTKESPVIIDKVFGDFNAYMEHTSQLNAIVGDIKTRKRKAVEYLDSVGIDYGAKIILYRQLFPTDDSYNYEIIDYLNERDDITYSTMEEILNSLGMTVDEEGNITWN